MKKLMLSVLCLMFALSAAIALVGCKGEHNHSFTEQRIEQAYLVAEPKCNEKAKYYYSCKCGAKGTDIFELPYAKAHVFEKKDATEEYLNSEATCTEKATYYYSCSGCGIKGEGTFEYGDTLEHDVSWTVDKEPTCLESGHRNGQCILCGQVFEEEMIIVEHEYGNYISNKDGTHTRICLFDSSHVETVQCSGGFGSCEKKAICDFCGEEYGDYVHNKPISADREATCLKKGYVGRIVCASCNAVIDEGEIVPKKGHKLGSWYVFEPSTENVSGFERRECENCDYFESKKSPLKGHSYVEQKNVEATCTSYGYTVYKCVDCEDTYNDNYIDKLPHAETLSTVKATCLNDGYTLHKCNNCSYEYVTDYKMKKGHEYTEWQTSKNVTCEEDGEERRVCQNCELEERRSIAAVGHKYTVTDVEETDEVIKTTYTCEVCSSTIVLETETEQYDVTQESQLTNQSEDFSFTVIYSGENAVEHIKNNVAIIDAYFVDTEYEQDAVCEFTVSSSETANEWIIMPVNKYEQGLTYIVKLSGEVRFKDYYGKQLTFGIRINETNEVEIKEGVKFLKSLEQEFGGYYPYKLETDRSSDFIYLTLQKIDGINVGDIIFIGDAEGVEELSDLGEGDACFGKVEIIYVNDDSEYILVLSCPELNEIFEKLDVSFEQVINFDDNNQAAKNLEAQAADALLVSDDFAEFLAISELSISNYCQQRDLVAEVLDQSTFKKSVNINNPQVRRSGTKIELILNGTIDKDLKTKKGNKVGSFKLSFEINATIEFKIEASYKIKKRWFIPVGIDYFDIRLIQMDSFAFKFNVDFDVDYELDKDKELVKRYVYNNDSLKVHTATCSYVNRTEMKNYSEIKAEELYEYASKPGYTMCILCKPLEGLDRTAFVINTAERRIHCYNCEHAKAISVENRQVVYSIKQYGRGYSYCDYCKPQLKEKTDFDNEMLSTLEYGDWAQIVEDVKAMAKSTNASEYNKKGIKLCSYTANFAWVCTANIEVRYILSFKIEASLKYNYSLSRRNVYGMRIQGGGARTYSTHEETKKMSELTAVGSISFRTGVQADVYVSIVGLSKWLRAGFTVDAGVYCNVDGIANLNNSSSKNSYAAMYFEAGLYLNISAYYKVFWWNGNVQILSLTKPIYRAGFDKAYYAYVNDIDTLNLSSKTYNLAKNGLFDLYYYNIKTKTKGTETLSLKFNTRYTISCRFDEGKYITIKNGLMTVAPSAPCCFSDTLTIVIRGNKAWNNYVSGSCAFFLETRVVKIQYKGDGIHSFVLSEEVGSTCSSEGYRNFICENCGKQKNTIIDKIPHTPAADWVVTKEAACITSGEKVILCTVCGLKTQTQEIPALGHDLSMHDGKAAACTESGWEEYETCTRCDYTTYEIIKALGHDLEIVEAKEPTCTEDGWEEYETCTRCDYTTFERIKALGHIIKGEWEVIQEPTCVEDGEKISKCSRCGEAVYVEAIPLLGHDLVEHEPKNPTCFAEGWSAYVTCARPGCSYSTLKSLPPVPHTPAADWVVTKEADCITSGEKAILCTVCGFKTQTQEIPASGHDLKAHAGKAATCTESGWEKYETCTRCDYSNYTALAALGHSFGDWLMDVNATCTTPGKAHEECSRCHIVNEREIPALGHNKEYHVGKAATCTEIGWVAYETCTRCDYTTYVEIPALGHDFVDGVCTRCGEGDWNPTEGLKYTLNSDGVSYSCAGIGTATAKDIVIAKEYNGLPVTSIGDWAFYYCSGLTSITISDSVTSIGNSAFLGCSGLTSVTIPDSVTSIGDWAFYYCSGLTSITISDSVTSIGDYAFYYCSGLKFNEYDNGLYLGNGTNPYVVLFKAKSKDITSCAIYEKCKFIYDSAFENCSGLTSITIPDSVTSIGSYAFDDCSGLESIVVEAGNAKYHSVNNCLIKTASKTLIAGCKNSIIPSDGSVISIGDCAFYGCSGLTSVTIPDSVTSIGNFAFYDCSGLTSVIIPDSVTSIGNFAFYDCSGLTSVIIPDSVTSIGYSVFSGCSGLTSVIIPDSVTSIGSYAFDDCSGLESIVVEAGNAKYHSVNNCLIKTASKTLIAGCKNSIIPSDGSVISIGDCAFYGCSGLTSVTIPDSVTSIGNSAFYGCSGLTSITIPDSVTSIGSSAFAYCRGLTSVTIGNSVTSIGNSAFV